MMPPRRPRSRFMWNIEAGRYVDRATGRFVSRSAVRRALDQTIDASAERLAAATAALQRGGSVDEWQTAMRMAIKDVHLYAAAVARGGWAQMTQSDFGAVGAILRKQYAYLDRFAAEIRAGLPRDGRLLARMKLYVMAARTTHQRFDARERELRGDSEERNVLSAGENCAECVEQADRGWVPIGELVPVGQRVCLGNCLCEIEYR